MGAGGGLIFKGSGFYLTDYKKSHSPSVAKKEKEKPKSPDGPASSKSTRDAAPGSKD
jgi:predicted nucleic acid-binding Zn ribbon protein